MLSHIDNLLRQLLIAGIDEIADESQVRFQPPDQDWRTYVGTLTVLGLPANALNVYLVDVRENRKLRSNERVRQRVPGADGMVREVPAPRRVDCHYLISAWSPATVTPAVEPTLDEHALLYKAIVALDRAEPLVPRKVYAPSPLPAGFPLAIADDELPTTLLPVEGYAKLAEFWGTMGEDHRLRPVIHLVLTVPLLYEPQPMGGMVTTRYAVLRPRDSSDPGDVLVEIGGRVVDSTHPLPDGSPSPLPGAWVTIETMLGKRLQLTRCDAFGRYTFATLRDGDYRLRASTETLGQVVRDIHLPSPSGEYDLSF
ncbi:MAG: DUF4255 domain-containing protein [Rhodanobacteraceae bacterium]|nr:DUF4255 domain-containing protein [Rhodanobacteraceae bacterium]